jgi:outer membrane immunogenic protein
MMVRLHVALLAAVAVVGFDAAAFAADMPTKMPIKAPPVVGYAWDGFYAGGYVGSVLGQNTGETPAPGNPAGTRTGGMHFNDYNFAGGVTAGYNWRVAPNWLVGLEADVGYFGLSQSFKEYNDVLTAGTKSDWNATVRARGGYLTGPSLLYVTGGVAFVHMTDSFGGLIGSGGVVSLAPEDSSTTRVGWTAGAGIETKLSRNWSSKSEYLFADVGDHSFGSTPFGVGTIPATGGLVPTIYHHHQYHVIKTGLNYNFGGGPDEGLPFFTGKLLPSNHNWNGLYAGLNVGVGASNTYAVDPSTSSRGQADVNGAGFAGGAQIGYNYMITPRYLVGVEGDIGALGMRSNFNDWFDTTAVFEQNTNWYATARARAGISNGPALFYFTGGAAWVNMEDGFGRGSAISTGDLAWHTRSGWTFGGGTEVALNERWSAKMESLFINTGTHFHTNTPPPLVGFNADFKERFVVVRAGLNYKFTD